jgi:hypothetical protein
MDNKMKPTSVKDSLPSNNTYVLARYTGGNWLDSTHQSGVVWKVVKFVRGISKAKREAMLDCERKRQYHSEDEWGNNLRPYVWKEWGPGRLFGQDVDFWMPLPEDSDCIPD